MSIPNLSNLNRTNVDEKINECNNWLEDAKKKLQEKNIELPTYLINYTIKISNISYGFENPPIPPKEPVSLTLEHESGETELMQAMQEIQELLNR
ncbi:MAG: hypothetical protein VX777_00825 [Chlamydiota bacterium]|nr:hypothetical protein [Chlamydiota bacterium]